jgi:hypothetical protein
MSGLLHRIVVIGLSRTGRAMTVESSSLAMGDRQAGRARLRRRSEISAVAARPMQTTHRVSMGAAATAAADALGLWVNVTA